ncbi:phosphatase PAP2 family protein [Kribbella sp. NPDC055110]
MRVAVVEDERVRALTPWVVVGLVGTVLGGVGFGWLADAAGEGDGLAAFDPELTADVVARRTPGLTEIAQSISFVGNVPVLLLLTAIVALGLWFRTKRWEPGALLAVGMVGAGALTYGLKVLIERHRPDAAFMLGPIDTGFAFPSGHTLSSTVFFSLLAALVWYADVRRATKIAATAMAIVLSLAMGASRVYLGYHWGTDVLAGWIVALTWLCLLATAVHLLRYGAGRRL